MKVELELWHLILVFMSCIGGCWAVAVMFFGQFEKRLSERFKAQDEMMEKYLDEGQRVMEKVAALERDFLTWRAEMPNQYVRREDYIRNQTVLEAKLDRIVAKIEVIQLKGQQL